jgi:hypothetical protein
MRVLTVAILALAAGGCGDKNAQLRGQLRESGQPLNLAGDQTALSFHRLVDGKTDPNGIYPAAVASDGSFEMHASGGSLPPGRYRVLLESWGAPKGGPMTDRFGGRFSKDKSKLEYDIVAGQNDLTIDLPAK